MAHTAYPPAKANTKNNIILADILAAIGGSQHDIQRT